MEAWTGDAGAWPVMGIIAFACFFCSGYGFHYLTSNPDARLGKSNRKSFFRGELRGAEL